MWSPMNHAQIENQQDLVAAKPTGEVTPCPVASNETGKVGFWPEPMSDAETIKAAQAAWAVQEKVDAESWANWEKMYPSAGGRLGIGG